MSDVVVLRMTDGVEEAGVIGSGKGEDGGGRGRGWSE